MIERIPPDDDDERPAQPDAPEALPRPIRLRDVPDEVALAYLVDRFLVQHEINAIVGDGGSMKSTELYAVAAAIATGNPAFGELPAQRGPVLYISGEDSRAVIRNRLTAIATGHRWDREALLDNVHILTQQDDGVDLDDPRWQGHLIEVVSDLRIIATMCDPMIDLCGDAVNENNNSDAKRITRYLRTLIARTDTTATAAMHVTKPAEGKTERAQRVRGAGVWKNSTRQCWWSELAGGGVELEDIKRNRTPARGFMRLKVEITSEPNNDLVWQCARITLDTEGAVVNNDVIRLLLYLNTLTEPRSGRDIDSALDGHRLSRDRATTARMAAQDHRWISYQDGPRSAKLWSLTEAGRGRLMLSPEYAGSVR